eukprot:13414133-Ditylum_brightwellii.AAC.1
MRSVNDSIQEAYTKQRAGGIKDTAKLLSLYYKQLYPTRKEALKRLAKDEGEMKKISFSEIKMMKKEKKKHKSPVQLKYHVFHHVKIAFFIKTIKEEKLVVGIRQKAIHLCFHDGIAMCQVVTRRK